VILNDDPLTDINNIKKIQLVIKGGRIYYPVVLLGTRRIAQSKKINSKEVNRNK